MEVVRWLHSVLCWKDMLPDDDVVSVVAGSMRVVMRGAISCLCIV